MRISAIFTVAAFVFAAPQVAVAGSAELVGIKDGCLMSTNWSESACQCLADKAGDLEDIEQAFLAATLNQKSTEVIEIRLKMTVPQLTNAGMFLPNTAPACQGG